MIAWPGMSSAPAMTENRFVQSSPVQSVPCVDLPLSLVQVDLNSIAVEFDFMEPLVAGRCPSFEGGELRFDESGHRRFFGRNPNSTHTLGHHTPNAN
jgi:hypothetical protein